RRRRAVRRQYRHAAARQRAAARSGALGPAGAAQAAVAGSAGRAVQRRAHLRPGTRQHHRGVSPARVHHAARQGAGHRHRVRDARPRASGPADRRADRRG
ncbi:hypothetical protein LTR94_036407, partial [Friedmanniomyces endolithicus]